MIKTKWITNPFFLYIISFLLVIIIYSLHWSSAYPKLSYDVLFYFFLTFIIAFFFGAVVHRIKMFELKIIDVDSRNGKFLLAVIIGYLIEFIYNGGIPFLLLFTSNGSYGDFTGIPVFHVLLASFSIYYPVYIFHQYLCSRRKKELIYFIVFLFIQLLIINRGGIFFIILACLFLYFSSFKIIRLKNLILLISFFAFILFIFGLMGNVRTPNGRKNKDIILNMTGAKSSFVESNVPKEYYWPYLYLASPLGNFQELVNKVDVNINERKFKLFLYQNIIPDFIGKRLSVIDGKDDDKIQKYFVFENINASTFYANAFRLLGWSGPVLMFCFMVFNIFMYILFIGKKSFFFNSGFSLLLTIVFFQVFNNLWPFSGLSLTLFYPILFSIFRNKRLKKAVLLNN